MIDVAMLSCNRKRITEITIRELRKRTRSPHRLIVIDNGSTDGSVEMLEALFVEGLIDELECSVENTGVHVGFNMLLNRVKSEPLYICTDSDLVPAVPDEGGDWLSKLTALMRDNPEYGAIACRPQILIGEHGDFFKNSLDVRETGHIGAHLRIMRTGLIREIGGWKHEKSPSRNNEDWFIGGKLKKAGFKVGYARDVRVIHLMGQRDLGEDPWGYPGKMTPQDHGHREIWPPADHFGWQRLNFDWETCTPKISA